MKKSLLKGSLFTIGASLWWGVIGVLYFKFVSFASALELSEREVKYLKEQHEHACRY
mgnify:CR=1 FL=1